MNVESSQNLFRDFKSLKNLWPYLKTRKRQLFLAAALIPGIAILQSSLPLILKNAVDQGIMKSDAQKILYFSGFYLTAIIIEYIFRATQTMTTAYAIHGMIRDIRAKLVAHVLNLKCSFHDRTMSGSLVTRATSDFDNLSESLNMGVLTSIVDLSVLLGLIIGMFILNVKLALCTLLILPLVYYIVRFFSLALKQAMLKARAKIAKLNAFTQECLFGHTTIKLLSAEGAAQEKYKAMNNDYRDAQMKSVILDAMMFSALDGIATVTVGIVLWFTVTQFTSLGGLSAGVMVAFIQYIQQFFEPLKQLGNKMAMLQGAFTSIDRVFGVLNVKEKVGGGEFPADIAGNINFRNVFFRYSPDSQPVLKEISFSLDEGQSLALVGATGSGKSTVIKLISKLYDGYEGEISIDGHDLKGLDPQRLRGQMAIVPQDIVLFDGDVTFNIALGQDFHQHHIEEAAARVGASRFIEELPGKYGFKIKEQGTNLSHGQRQLIAFARALVRQPKLVILDEATSSVDPESEQIIQQAIEKILEGRTVIVIAHRLSTIKRCDKILVMDHGRIVEEGDHQSLLDGKKAYYSLHQALQI